MRARRITNAQCTHNHICGKTHTQKLHEFIILINIYYIPSRTESPADLLIKDAAGQRNARRIYVCIYSSFVKYI